ncbi:MAG: hypothetical protein GY880_22140 [Planctomycetaceae bacterium]|nr:hypothetical protein [Planctomycetaceae bacterium]
MSLKDSDPLAEVMQSSEPFLNYCHWNYDSPLPDTSLHAPNRLRPSSLLVFALRAMDDSQRTLKTIRNIQEGVGLHRCVYGIKWFENHWESEVYVYDYQRCNRILSVDRFLRATCGELKSLVTVDDSIPYFMFSFDLGPNSITPEGEIGGLNIYVGNPGSTVSSGISYYFEKDVRLLKNFYFFFDAQRQQDEIKEKILCSIFGPRSLEQLGEILCPILSDCTTICLSNKPECNTIYFSGVDCQQLIHFLEWQNYPDDFKGFVAQHRNRLNHLRYDVGIDYRYEGNQVVFLKTGIYGVF